MAESSAHQKPPTQTPAEPTQTTTEHKSDRYPRIMVIYPQQPTNSKGKFPAKPIEILLETSDAIKVAIRNKEDFTINPGDEGHERLDRCLRNGGKITVLGEGGGRIPYAFHRTEEHITAKAGPVRSRRPLVFQ